jgi:hypothetical protein
MTGFDPDAFMHETYTEAASTRETPLPEGEYLGTISKVTPPRQTNNGYVLQEIHFRVDHPELEEELGRSVSTARHTLFLDMTDSGSLDLSSGKNIGLGRLRAALGQNEPGEPWSPSQMEGQQATIRVKHTPDKNNPEVIYTDVRGVSAPA